MDLREKHKQAITGTISIHDNSNTINADAAAEKCEEISIEFAEQFAEWVDNMGYRQVGNSEWRSQNNNQKGITTSKLIFCFINKTEVI